MKSKNTEQSLKTGILYRHGDLLLRIEKTVQRTLRGRKTAVCVLACADTGEHYGEVPLDVAARCLVPLWQTDDQLAGDIDGLKRAVDDLLPPHLADLFGAFYKAYRDELSNARKESSI